MSCKTTIFIVFYYECLDILKSRYIYWRSKMTGDLIFMSLLALSST